MKFTPQLFCQRTKTYPVMKIKILSLLISISIQTAFAQLITTSPVFPSHNLPVEVIFNAQEGSGGLAGYTGDVYAHTGVITNLSGGPSDWKYVKTDWGENTPETKLERIGTDLYKFTTGTQSIREYYGVPESEVILQMAFVFRSGVMVGSSYLEGKTENLGDIFVEVYPEGLSVMITEPVNYANLVLPGEQIIIDATANNADTLLLLIDGSLITYTTTNTLNYTFNAALEGKHYIRVKSVYGDQTASDSAYYFVKKEVVTLPLPENIKDGINYTGDSTVVLSLYAPGKDNVFILGDFNNWEYADEGFMYKDGNRFWKEIGGLIPQKEYIFQYKVDDEILIADPYADKLVDPWNDQYISSSTYPNLIPYPFDKTDQIASVLQTAQTPYEWTTTSFDRPAKTDLVIYELLIRDFVATHDYQTLIDTLNYLKRLGVNAIELMPVYEFEGNSSWGYNTAFQFAPDKYYGSKNDLKEFIDVCHQQGFAVILDIVLNHVFNSSPFARLYWDAQLGRPSSNNPWLNPVAKHDFNVGNDFNHESQATKDLVQRVVEYWITDYHVDGYRFDLSKGFTQNNTLGNTTAWGYYDASRVAIWMNIANKIWAADPGVYVILEHFADNSEEKVLANAGMMLWGNSNYNYRQTAMGKNDNDISWGSYKTRGWNDPHLVTYMESHDEERVMVSILTDGNMTNPWYNTMHTDTAFKRMAAAFAFFYTIPGPKMIWQFGELAYDYSIDYNGRLGEKPIRWDYQDEWRRKHLFDVTSALIKLKKENEVFHTTDFTVSGQGLQKNINLRSDEMSVTVIGNFSVQPAQVFPNFNILGKWYDYFTGDSLNVTSLTDNVYMKAGEFRLYTSKRLTVPETGLAIPEKAKYGNTMLGDIYPNPTNGRIAIPLNLVKSGNIAIELYNSAGYRVSLIYQGQTSAGNKVIEADIQGLPAGIYYLRLTTTYAVEYSRLVLTR